jgi:hypothetical protein
MFAVQTDSIPWERATSITRAGDVSRKLVREDEVLPGVGFAMDMVHYHEEGVPYTTPRHRHDFEQIRICLSGEPDFGGDLKLNAGDICYFPAGAYYGPQYAQGGEIILIQWSDAWVTRDLYRSTYAALSSSGAFDGGVYRSVAADGSEVTKDGPTAIWEHAYRRKLRVPEPRYVTPILMRPSSFEWLPYRSGISARWLGRLTERDLGIATLRWESSAPLAFPKGRTHFLFVTAGTLRCDGDDYESRTAVWTDAGIEAVVEGSPGTEAIWVEFPAPAN